jgi:ribosome production factor 2
MGKQLKKGKSKPKKATIHQRVLDLSLSSKSHIIKKAKTRKGKKILESKEAKIIENPKTAIFIKGTKSGKYLRFDRLRVLTVYLGNTINTLMRELALMRGYEERSRLFMRKGYDIRPFENVGELEVIAAKQDCSLICFGSH